MAGFGKILSRTFFWSYERGTWQYDLAVIVILVFVLLTPRSWFRDQPQVDLPAAPEQVQMVSPAGAPEVYQVDARTLNLPRQQTAALQNELHNALQQALPKLHNGRFTIGKIESVHDDHGFVIAYRVEIQR